MRKLNLKGYSNPLSPEGKAALVTPTPHHYGGQFIFVDYRADAEQVARYPSGAAGAGPHRPRVRDRR